MHSTALPRVFARARLQASTLMQHEEAERNTHSSYCERKIHSHAQHFEGGARVSLAVVADEDLPRVAHKRLWCAALSITRTRGVAEKGLSCGIRPHHSRHTGCKRNGMRGPGMRTGRVCVMQGHA